MSEKKSLPNSPLVNQKYQAKKRRKGIRLDRVNPGDFTKYVWPLDDSMTGFFCEACVHYIPSTQKCSFGYQTQHRRELQLKVYELTGQMAFCRAIEID